MSTDPGQLGPTLAAVTEPGGDLLRAVLRGPRAKLEGLAAPGPTVQLPDTIPAAIEAGLVDRLGLRIGDELSTYAGGHDLPLVLTRVLPSIPGLGGHGDGVLVDSRLVGLHGLDGLGLLPQPRSWWLRAESGPDQAAQQRRLATAVTAAAGRAGVTLATVTRAERAGQLRADPLVLGLRRLLQALLGICAAVVLAALVLADAVAARARRGELAALRAVGMSTGQVRRTAGAEQVLVVGTIVLLGVALGALLAPLVLPALLGPLVLPSPGGPDPAAVTVQAAQRAAAPWPAVLALGVAVVLAGLGSALLRGRRVARMDVPGVLREGVR